MSKGVKYEQWQAVGSAALWQTFGLSYASWLVLPRVLMHAMPDAWQGRMAELIDEFHGTFEWPDEIENVHVSCRVNGKIAKLPDWLAYKYPDTDKINSFRKRPIPCPTQT